MRKMRTKKKKTKKKLLPISRRASEMLARYPLGIFCSYEALKLARHTIAISLTHRDGMASLGLWATTGASILFKGHNIANLPCFSALRSSSLAPGNGSVREILAFPDPKRMINGSRKTR